MVRNVNPLQRVTVYKMLSPFADFDTLQKLISGKLNELVQYALCVKMLKECKTVKRVKLLKL